MLEGLDLHKRFGPVHAVRGVTLQVRPGEIYGLLGPNGAGKTTTIRMMTGILHPTEGTVQVFGKRYESDALEIKRNLGVLFDEPRPYPALKGKEYLSFIQKLYRAPAKDFQRRADELCGAFQIDFLNKRTGELSHGMKQKLMLVAVLAREPRAIFLDEPTVGLDAHAVLRLREYLQGLAVQGSAIVLTTHVLDTAQRLCHRIGIVHRGQMVAEGTFAELKAMQEERNPDAEVRLEEIFLSLTADEEQPHA